MCDHYEGLSCNHFNYTCPARDQLLHYDQGLLFLDPSPVILSARDVVAAQTNKWNEYSPSRVMRSESREARREAEGREMLGMASEFRISV